jgi:hypothetical protein
MAVIGKPIELEPQHVGRDLRRRLDGHAADGGERVGDARKLGGLGETEVGTGRYDRRAAHGRYADRRRIGAAEQLDRGRRQRRGAAIARDQLDGVERTPVAGDATVGPCPAVEIFEGKTRHVPAGAAAQIGDGRITLPQLRLFGRADSTEGIFRGLGLCALVHRCPEMSAPFAMMPSAPNPTLVGPLARDSPTNFRM